MVARYNFLARFELSSPNRPATKSLFVAKIATLPQSLCLRKSFSDSAFDLLSEGTDSKKNDKMSGKPPVGAPKLSCKSARSVTRCVGRCLESSQAIAQCVGSCMDAAN